MQVTAERTFIITMSEKEASEIARFLNQVILQHCPPDSVKKFNNVLNTELMEVR